MRARLVAHLSHDRDMASVKSVFPQDSCTAVFDVEVMCCPEVCVGLTILNASNL